MKNTIVLSLFLLLFNSCNLAPGSYPYAKEYSIDLSEEKLIDVIKIFKNNNPEYITPDGLGLQDGRRTIKDHWYHIYFNYPQEKIIIKTWVRKKTKTETTFAFIAVKKYIGMSNWRFINKDFTKSKNKEEIKEFENRILYQLGINDFIED